MTVSDSEYVEIVPGYGVNRLGTVRNLKYGRDLSPQMSTRGRPIVSLPRHDGTGRFVSKGVHVLVCTAFHGPRPDGLEVSHLDGNQLNNRADNLAWETKSQNQLRRRDHGTDDIGFKNTRASVTPSQRDSIAERYSMGETQQGIADSIGVSRTTVQRIVTGKRFSK